MADTGRAALERAFAEAHPDAEPIVVPRADRPLECIVAYAVEEPPHWHLITMGLSNLGTGSATAMGPHSGKSGWGQELTLRVARGQELEPPAWALDVLAAEAADVLRKRAACEHGNAYDIESDLPDVVAVVPISDVALPVVDGPTGRVEFVQVVGITEDELESESDLEPWEEYLSPGGALIMSDRVWRSGS